MNNVIKEYEQHKCQEPSFPISNAASQGLYSPNNQLRLRKALFANTKLGKDIYEQIIGGNLIGVFASLDLVHM